MSGEEVFDLNAAVRRKRQAANDAAARETEERYNRVRGEVLQRLKSGMEPEEYMALIRELKPVDTRWKLAWHGVEYLIGQEFSEGRRTTSIFIQHRNQDSNADYLNNGGDLLLWLSER